MSVIHYKLENNLQIQNTASLDQSGAFLNLLRKTRQMRALAQSDAEKKVSGVNKKLLNALDLIDQAAGPKTVLVNPPLLGSKVMQRSLAGNIDHVKIAAENHSAAFSTPVNLGKLSGLVETRF
jgi:hypothetical protein